MKQSAQAATQAISQRPRAANTACTMALMPKRVGIDRYAIGVGQQGIGSTGYSVGKTCTPYLIGLKLQLPFRLLFRINLK